MNAQNAKYYLPLVQALADGKTIQMKGRDDTWHDATDPKDTVGFTFPPEYYRIKKEPRIFELMIHKYTGVIEDNDFISYDPDIWEPITVQEVL